MFEFSLLNQIQIEITNRCQASCPMCLRNIHGGIKNPLLKLNDWTFEDFCKIFNKEVLLQIKNINFCGDFGDPILNNDLIKMCSYIKNNSDVSIDIHTNGSARSNSWWKSLATALPKNHKVEFALDGLRETHKIYRIGTDFDTIISNSTNFINAGGLAHWMFIKFKHNEHEIDQARDIASTLGFKSFVVKNSKRFGKEFPVLNKKGKITHLIQPPTNSNIKPVKFNDLKDYKNWKTTINCFTLESKEVYIDAHGHLMPCCLIASFLYSNYNRDLYEKYGLMDEDSIINIANEVKTQIYNLISEFGGFESLDVNKYSIKHIMNQPIWQELIRKKWENNSSDCCKILCSNKSPYIKISEQVSRE